MLTYMYCNICDQLKWHFITGCGECVHQIQCCDSCCNVSDQPKWHWTSLDLVYYQRLHTSCTKYLFRKFPYFFFKSRRGQQPPQILLLYINGYYIFFFRKFLNIQVAPLFGYGNPDDASAAMNGSIFHYLKMFQFIKKLYIGMIAGKALRR